MLTAILLTILTFVQLNCENLFDCTHDSGKNDTEFTPEGKRHWTNGKYWRKTENIAKELIGCCGRDTLPDLITLCEVENDSVMDKLVRHTALGRLGYRYIMTDSRDERGIDVALVYNTMSFRPILHHSIRPEDNHSEHPLRDILYVAGRTTSGDTLHVMAVHAPSKFGGKKESGKRRMVVARKIGEIVGSIINNNANTKIIISGDFNDTAESEIISTIEAKGMINVTRTPKGNNGAQASYKYKGKWESIDHILVSSCLSKYIVKSYIGDNQYNTCKDIKYGGVKPKRSFNGYRFVPEGCSDHLPVILKIHL